MTCLKRATRAAPGTAAAVACVARVHLPCYFGGELRALRRDSALKRPFWAPFGPVWPHRAPRVDARPTARLLSTTPGWLSGAGAVLTAGGYFETGTVLAAGGYFETGAVLAAGGHSETGAVLAAGGYSETGAVLTAGGYFETGARREAARGGTRFWRLSRRWVF
jgi:hypothetical protein